ncbi:unnamed protein product [Schistocephalus solidus]|uniref:Sorcin n=1 Tax=Schistocephalus solidus TaxID=70667 RepID=A0A183SPM6_SCHSO|nr:unnamed protein product [Schistocephalus solidus]
MFNGSSTWTNLRQIFKNFDKDQNGSITAKELQEALQNGVGTPFDINCASLMISLFDRDNNGTIDINEFCQLFNYIMQWKQLFEQHDSDRSGSIDYNEFRSALRHFRYNLSDKFTGWIMGRFDRQKRGAIGFDKYIYILVCLQMLTDSFKALDVMRRGVATMSFEQFLVAAFNMCV